MAMSVQGIDLKNETRAYYARKIDEATSPDGMVKCSKPRCGGT